MPSLTLNRDASAGDDGDRVGPRGPDAGPDGPGPVGGTGDTLPGFSFNRDSSGGDRAEASGEEAVGEVDRTGGTTAGASDGRTERQSRSVDPGEGESTEDVSPGVDELLSPEGPELLAYDADVDRVVDRLYRELERKMRIERERRGL
ncbi:hypothetical protein BRD00_02785 [Halobacteriales archaeon QS_8_69_26]|nr:MAG: hypothetical protein BRD00_02785 [Halobacteriales archaeon QS_8_69_26]